MKTNSVLLPVLLALVLSAGTMLGEFHSPRVEADDLSRPEPAPSGPVSAWTVSSHRDSGPGTLRQAISNAAAGDTITFNLRHPGVIVLESTLVINKDLTILGPGPDKLIVARTFRRAPSFRVFNVRSGTVTLAGMTIVNGRALNADGASDNLGGGILNRGTLTVSNCVVAFNQASTEAGGIGFGGGIFSLGRLTIVDSTFTRNSASGVGGGICTFHSPNFVLERSTVSRNYAELQAGGVNFQGTIGSVKNSTISGNKTEEEGVGGGLVQITYPAETSELSVSATTITRNVGGSNAVIIAALPSNLGSTTRFIGTLVAANGETNFFFDGNPVVHSLGHNLDSDGTSGFQNGVNGDIVGSLSAPVNARLGPLAPNGGPTFTHALLMGSPAIDAGACEDAAGQPLVVDQRGNPRPQGLACDIGAFENQAPTLTCPANQSVECGSPLVATVADRDGDALTLVWSVDFVDVQTNSLRATHPPALRKVTLNAALAAGSHTISLRVTDGKAPVVGCSSTVVVLEDSRPPKIQRIEASPSRLWPVNNQMVPVRLTVRAEDCGNVSCRIISVGSNQRLSSTPDWVVTGDLTLDLRAKRTGDSDRIYTVTVECTDEKGNSSRGTVKISVPRKNSGDDRDDDDDDDDHHDKDKDGKKDKKDKDRD